MEIYRSLLFIPSASIKMLDKIDILRPDAFILDLEDSVPEDKKAQARENIKNKLQEIIFKSENKPENNTANDSGNNHDNNRANKPSVFIRINGLGTQHFLKDIEETISPAVSGYMVPKFESFNKLSQVIDFILKQEEEKNIISGKIKILLMIESPKGIIELVNPDKYNHISERLAALTIGWEDFTREITDFGEISTGLLDLARMLIIFYAKANGLLALDAVYRNFSDDDGLRAESSKAVKFGFNGKLAIHPKQIDIINSCFMPDKHEIEKMELILQNRERIEKDGAINIDGVMYDPPHLIWALKVKKYLDKVEGKV